MNDSSTPPASETESRLARIWADVLHREVVGINDDYFDLGGNSLLAVNLFAKIESQLGIKLPLSSLIEAPTVVELARLLDARGSHNPVVLIRKGGDGLPLFLIHDADGETMLYRGLAHHLDSAHTVYGLHPYSKANHPILHTCFERDGRVSYRQHSKDSGSRALFAGWVVRWRTHRLRDGPAASARW